MIPFPSIKSTFQNFVTEALKDMRLTLKFVLFQDLKYISTLSVWNSENEAADRHKHSTVMIDLLRAKTTDVFKFSSQAQS